MTAADAARVLADVLDIFAAPNAVPGADPAVALKHFWVYIDAA